NRVDVQILAEFQQPLGILKHGQLKLTGLLKLRIARLLVGHAAIGRNRNAGRVNGNLNSRIDQATGLSRADDEVSLGIERQVAGSREHRLRSYRIGNLDESLAFDGQVKLLARFLKRALNEVRLRALHSHAQADVRACRREIAAGVLSARQNLVA